MPLAAGDASTNAGGSRPQPKRDNKPGVTSGLQTWANEMAGTVRDVANKEYQERNTGAIQDILSQLASAATVRDSTGFDINSVSTAQSALDQAQSSAAKIVNPWEMFGRQDPDLISQIATGSSGPDPALIAQIAHGSTGPDEELIAQIANPPAKVPTRASAQAEVDVASQGLEAALDAQRRRAVGSDVAGPYKPGQPSPGAAGNNVKEMSWENYQALSPKEKAAVDFNTLLVQAVKADARNQDEYAPTSQQQLTYDNLVEKTFGEDDGTDYYAPEVMGLLHQIGYTDDAAKLQDFLGLNAAITKGDLKNLKVEAGPTIRESRLNPVQQDQYQLTETLASSTMLMEREMAKANELLSSIPETARYVNAQYVGGQLGGTPSQPDILGYSDDPTSSYFQQAFGTLATKSNQGDRDLIMAQVQQDLSPGDFRKFLDYADARTANAMQFGLKLGDPKEVLAPERFRKLLGLDDGSSDG